VVREWGDLRGWVGLASTLRRRGRYAEALQVLEDASAAAPAGDLRLLDLERSWTLSISGRLPESVAAARRGLAEERPADRVTAQLLLQVARAATEEGRPEDAVPDLERALAALPASDVQGAASTLRLLGGAHEAAGRLEAASAALERGLALAERAGDVEEVGGCLINLGLVQLARGDLAQAELANLRAIEQFERIGHEAGRASGYTNLAEVLVEAGDVDRAHGFAQRALDLAQQIGHRIIAADATLRIATILAARGRHREAAQAAEDAALLAAETGLHGVARDAAALAVAQRARAADSPAEQA
jgi:tetratricopeptide (TPR) repeat protein